MGDERNKYPLALHLHDRVNVLALPVLGGLCLLSLAGHYDAAKVGRGAQLLLQHLLLELYGIVSV
jgi:hypothetical protein